MKIGLRRKLAYSAVFVSLATPAAFAQDTGANSFFRSRHTAVTQRPQPEFDAPPLRWGAFDARPVLNLGAGYNDNVFASETNKQEDTIYTISPGLDLSSNWTRHSLGAGFNVTHNQYGTFEDESITNASGYLRGGLNVTREINLGGQLTGGRFYEQRYAPSVPFAAAEPVSYDQFGGQIDFSWSRDRLRFEASVGQNEVDFNDVPVVQPATGPAAPAIDQDFRDLTQTSYRGRASYAVSPAVAVYVEGRLADSDYDIDPTRNSKLTTAQVGLNFEFAAPFRGDIGVGYFTDDRKLAGARDLDGLSVDGNLFWFPTQLTTVSFRGSRSVVDPGLLQSSTATSTSFGFRVDHELRRNIIIFGDANFYNLEYEGIDRDDDNTRLSVGVGYKVNRNARIDFSLMRFQQETSESPAPGAGRTGRDLEQNFVSISLRLVP